MNPDSYRDKVGGRLFCHFLFLIRLFLILIPFNFYCGFNALVFIKKAVHLTVWLNELLS